MSIGLGNGNDPACWSVINLLRGPTNASPILILKTPHKCKSVIESLIINGLITLLCIPLLSHSDVEMMHEERISCNVWTPR